jgi:ATP dependent DNA ligase domain
MASDLDRQEWRRRAPLLEEPLGEFRSFAHLSTRAAILDGELCLLSADGKANFRALLAEMRRSWQDEERLMFFAFDLLHPDRGDLRRLPLAERKRHLHRLCARSGIPFLNEIQTFPYGACSWSIATSSASKAWCRSARYSSARAGATSR